MTIKSEQKAAAGKVLTEDGHEGKIYALTGPTTVTFSDVAGVLGEVLGRRWPTYPSR